MFSSKTVKLAIAGALGALLAAIVGELPISLLLSSDPESHPVDVLFALDLSGSMSDERDGIVSGIEEFAQALESTSDEQEAAPLDWRVGLIGYGDGRTMPTTFGGSAFTSKTSEFRREVAITAGDLSASAENCLDAICAAAELDFRPDASKIVILIQDEPVTFSDNSKTLDDAQQALTTIGVDQIHYVVDERYFTTFTSIRFGDTDSTFSINTAATSGFRALMPQFASEIRSNLPVIIGSGNRGPFATTAIVAFWTGMLGLGVTWLLIGAQNLYLRRLFLSTRDLALGGAGFLAGAASGLVAQLAFTFLGAGQ